MNGIGGGWRNWKKKKRERRRWVESGREREKRLKLSKIKKEKLLEKLRQDGKLKLEGRDKEWIERKKESWRTYREKVEEDENDKELTVRMMKEIMLAIPERKMKNDENSKNNAVYTVNEMMKVEEVENEKYEEVEANEPKIVEKSDDEKMDRQDWVALMSQPYWVEVKVEVGQKICYFEGWGQVEIVLGSTHIVQQLLFSLFPSILAFDFDLILGSFFTFFCSIM